MLASTDLSNADLTKPIITKTKSIVIMPGQKKIDIDSEGHYLFNFKLYCNPVLTPNGFDIAQNYMDTISLKFDDITVSEMSINAVAISNTIYESNLDFFTESPVLLEPLDKTNIYLSIDYHNQYPKQISYLQYEIGYHNNSRQNISLSSKTMLVNYTVKSRYNGLYHWINLKSYCGKLVQ